LATNIDAAGTVAESKISSEVKAAIVVFVTQLEQFRANATGFIDMDQDQERDRYTSLYSRNYGITMLEKVLADAQQGSKTFALLYTDFDHFHLWNKQYGRDYGDLLLRQLADLIQSIVADQGIASRFAGEEFLIILPSVAGHQAKKLAQQICDQVSHEKIDLGEQIIPSVTITIGIAVYPTNGKTLVSLLRTLEDTVSQGKDAGRNRVILAKGVSKGGE
jgi:diguanylate cyclase (GGDEF)-like protein